MKYPGAELKIIHGGLFYDVQRKAGSGICQWVEKVNLDLRLGQDTTDFWAQVFDAYPEYVWRSTEAESGAFWGDAKPMQEGGINGYGRPAKGRATIKYFADNEDNLELRRPFITASFHYFSPDYIAPVIPGFTYSRKTLKSEKEGELAQIYYVRDRYTLIFIPNGGNIIGPDTISGVRYESSLSSYGSLKDYEIRKDGIWYRFAGWYDNELFLGEPINFYTQKMPALETNRSTMFLYAKWVPDDMLVTFDAKGGTINGSKTESKTVVCGEMVEDPGIPVKGTSEFLGWADESGKPFSLNTRITQYMTLSAIWDDSGAQLKVKYNGNGHGTFSGGTGTYADSRAYRNGTKISLRQAPESIDNTYFFRGWALSPDGALKYRAGQSIELSDSMAKTDGTIDLYAVYSRSVSSVSVTYHSNDGENKSFKSDEFPNNGQFTLKGNEKNWTRKGYVFDGWSTDAAGSTVYKSGTLMGADNTGSNDLYAVWKMVESDPVSITLSKKLNAPSGTTLAQHPASFGLYVEHGAQVGSVKTANDSNSEQTVSFDPIVFKYSDLPAGQDTAYKNFVIKEILPAGVSSQDPVSGGVTYDVSEHSIRLKLTLKGNKIDVEKYKFEASANGGAGGYVRDDSYYPQFINNYAASGTGELKIHKVLSGRPMLAGGFSFTVECDDPASAATLGGRNNTTVKPARTGSYEADGSIQLDFSAPGTYKYTIKEISRSAGGMNWDTHAVYVTAKATDNGDGTLSVTYSYDNSRSADTSDHSVTDKAVFRNSYEASAELSDLIKVEKTLAGRAWRDGDSFTFRLTEDSSMQDNNPGNKTAPVRDKNGADTSTLVVSASSSDLAGARGTKEAGFALYYSISDLKQIDASGRLFDDFYYIVEEDQTGNNTKGMTYDASSTRRVHVHVSDDANGKLTASIAATSDRTVYTNRYEAAPAVTGIRASKQVLGRDWLSGEEFTLVLRPGDAADSVPMPEGSSVDAAGPYKKITVNKANCTDVSFGDITFTSAQAAVGTQGSRDYYYTITEEIPASAVNNTADGLLYDSTRHSAKVTVTDDGQGQLSASVSYNNNGSSAPVFKNVYTPEPAEFIFKGTKMMSGRQLVSDRYSFEIVDAAGNRIADAAEVVNGAAGEISSRPLFFTTAKAYSEGNYAAAGGPGSRNYPLPAGNYYAREIVPDAAVAGSLDGAGRFVPDASGSTYADAKAQAAASNHADLIQGYFRDPATGVVYDASERTITVSVSDDNAGKITFTGVDYNAANLGGDTDHDRCRFANIYQADGTADVRVRKIVAGTNWDDNMEFKFRLEKTNASDPDIMSDAVQSVNKSKAPDYQASWEIAFTEAHIGNTYTYKINELDPSYSGYTAADWTVDTADHFVKIKVLDNNGSLAFDTEYFRGADSKGSSLMIQNRYIGNCANILAKKSVSDADGHDRWPAGESYTLKLEPVTVDAPMPDGTDPADNIRTVTVSHRSPDANFGLIDFKPVMDANGWTDHVFEYSISEEIPAGASGSVNGIVYDSSIYKAYVRVTKVGSGYDTKVTYGDTYASSTDAVPVIRNMYSPSPVTVELKAQKVISGRGWLSGDSFTFRLSGHGIAGYEDHEMTDGNVRTLKTVTFSLSDLAGAGSREFNYSVSELVPSEAVQNVYGGLTYSDAAHAIRVTVTDDGAGNLRARVTNGSGEEKPAVITNTYSAGSISASIEARKVMQGRDLIGGHYSFELVDTASSSVIAEAAAGRDGRISFNLPGLLSGVYNYEIREKQPAAGAAWDGVTYASNRIAVTVTVTDDGSGRLSADVAYADENGNALAEADRVFINRYSATGIAVLTAEKHLSGRLLTDSDSFTFVAEQVGGTYSAEFTADASNRFRPVLNIPFDQEFLKDGSSYVMEKSVTYRISEKNEGKPGFTYDDTVYFADVTVSDHDRDGELEVVTKYYTTDDGGITKNYVLIPEFTNSYSASGSTVIKVKKVMTGDELSHFTEASGESIFSFSLIDETGTAIQSGVKPVADESSPDYGVVSFAPLSFTQADLNGSSAVRRYIVAEDVPSDAVQNVKDGIHYTSSEHSVELHLKDSGNGKIEIQKYKISGGVQVADDGTLPEFINAYRASCTAVIAVKKHLEGRPIAGGGFSFVLKDLNPQSPSFEKVIGNTTVSPSSAEDSDAAAYFEPITFSQDSMWHSADGAYSVGGTRYFLYEVSELIPEGEMKNPGITYAEEPVYARVAVTNDHSGHLSASTEYFKDKDCRVRIEEGGAAVQAAPFTNYYKAEGAVEIKVRKVLEGRDFKAGDEFHFELSPAAGAPMPKGKTSLYMTASDGSVQTFRIPITLTDLKLVNGVYTGDFSYSLRELVPGGARQDESGVFVLDGVSYDNTVHAVSVKVTDTLRGSFAVSVKVDGRDCEVFDIINSYSKPDPVPYRPADPGDDDDPVTYTVTYVNGYGGLIRRFARLGYGEVTPKVAAPVRAGYAFAGWNPRVEPTVTKSVTYAALWVQNALPPDTPNQPGDPDTPNQPGGPDSPDITDQPKDPNAAAPDPEAPVEISEQVTPLAPGPGTKTWALINLICTVLTCIVGLGMLVSFIKDPNKEDDEDDKDDKVSGDDDDNDEEKKKRRKSKLLGLVTAVGSVVAFVLTEDMRNKMCLTDKWTIIMVCILAVSAALAFLTRNKRKDEDQEAE